MYYFVSELSDALVTQVNKSTEKQSVCAHLLPQKKKKKKNPLPVNKISSTARIASPVYLSSQSITISRDIVLLADRQQSRPTALSQALFTVDHAATVQGKFASAFPPKKPD